MAQFGFEKMSLIHIVSCMLKHGCLYTYLLLAKLWIHWAPTPVPGRSDKPVSSSCQEWSVGQENKRSDPNVCPFNRMYSSFVHVSLNIHNDPGSELQFLLNLSALKLVSAVAAVYWGLLCDRDRSLNPRPVKTLPQTNAPGAPGRYSDGGTRLSSPRACRTSAASPGRSPGRGAAALCLVRSSELRVTCPSSAGLCFC